MGIIKVTVVGGCGNKAAKNNGTFTVELPQETADLKMLKTLCRKHFGKYPSHTQAAFTMGDTAADGKAVTSADIKDGIVIRCGYNYSPGNLGALLGGQRGRGFGGRGFGGRGFGWVLARNYGF